MLVLSTEPVVPLAEDEHRERIDTGVRFSQWGATSDRFYTGSSDGVVKSWNVKRAPEDVLVADVANLRSIVMNGAFSPDYSRLLVGDGNGSIHVLRTGLHDDDPTEVMNFEPSERVEESATEGRDEANRLIANGELMLQFGQHYQGPNYQDASARRRARSAELDLVYQRIHQTANANVTFPTAIGLSTSTANTCTTQQNIESNKISNEEADDQDSSMDVDESALVVSQETGDSMDLS
jgi:WD40 repeat protein